MSKVALFIMHRSLPGKRDAVRGVWQRHMQPHIDRNTAHEAYFYCFNDSDPDSICVYQQYSDRESAQAFLRMPNYAQYPKEVEPLLAGQPEITTATPVSGETGLRFGFSWNHERIGPARFGQKGSVLTCVRPDSAHF